METKHELHKYKGLKLGILIPDDVHIDCEKKELHMIFSCDPIRIHDHINMNIIIKNSGVEFGNKY